MVTKYAIKYSLVLCAKTADMRCGSITRRLSCWQFWCERVREPYRIGWKSTDIFQTMQANGDKGRRGRGNAEHNINSLFVMDEDFNNNCLLNFVV